MLERLARWLRAAGHDAASAPDGAPGQELLQIAAQEGRTLLTKSRALAAQAGELGVLIEADGAEAEAAELGRKRELDWRLAPFTRCLIDNAVLAPASPGDLARMPPSAQALPGPFRVCPACGRLYWPGSHPKRMAARLERLAGSAPGPPGPGA